METPLEQFLKSLDNAGVKYEKEIKETNTYVKIQFGKSVTVFAYTNSNGRLAATYSEEKE